MQQEARLHCFINYEAEYVACCLAAQEAIWLRNFLQDLSLIPRVDDPIEIWCDNTAAIQYAKDPKFYRKSKHIKRRYHFVRNAIKLKEVVVKFLSTNKMIADPVTKSTPKYVFKAHMMSLGLCRV